jgi:hypothetical protein
LHTAAHEAAHVIQQRHGVQLLGGVGEVGDRYERNADAVADRVVAGRSASDLLAPFADGAQARGGPVQRVADAGAAPRSGRVVQCQGGGEGRKRTTFFQLSNFAKLMVGSLPRPQQFNSPEREDLDSETRGMTNPYGQLVNIVNIRLDQSEIGMPKPMHQKIKTLTKQVEDGEITQTTAFLSETLGWTRDFFTTGDPGSFVGMFLNGVTTLLSGAKQHSEMKIGKSPYHKKND